LRYSISVVSHGQGALVLAFLNDLDRVQPRDFEVIITSNVPETLPPLDHLRMPISVVRNPARLGFGANHNRAFEKSRGDFFVVANPDIRLSELDLAKLAQPFVDAHVGITAPRVVDSAGRPQDSARRFPTWSSLLARALSRARRADYECDTPTAVDWVAGMFMMLRRSAYSDLGGFDERRFFMYYEDVDLCRRMWASGWKVIWHPGIGVIHDAQRASHRSMPHLRWHAMSAFRFLTGL